MLLLLLIQYSSKENLWGFFVAICLQLIGELVTVNKFGGLPLEATLL